MTNATGQNTHERWRVGDGMKPLFASKSQVLAPTPDGDGEMIAASFNHNFEALSEARAARAVACHNAFAGMNPEAVAELVEASKVLRAAFMGDRCRPLTELYAEIAAVVHATGLLTARDDQAKSEGGAR